MGLDPLKEASTIKQNAQRKRKPRIIAVVNDSCTGCAGSPACVDYCPVENCMLWVTDPGTSSVWSDRGRPAALYRL